MSIPKKGSRTLTIDGVDYRWIVRKRDHTHLHLVVEAVGQGGQLLRAYFEPHDRYARTKDGTWKFQGQGRSITPDTVKRTIIHALHEGWTPNVKMSKPFMLSYWNTEPFCQNDAEGFSDEVELKRVAAQRVDDLRYDLSLDPEWRKRLFNSPPFKKILIPDDYYSLENNKAYDCGLRFRAFNEGVTDFGYVVFTAESVEFPEIAMSSINNPLIL